MKAGFYAVMAFGLVAVGCGKIPDLPDRAEILPSDVTRYAECEIRRAILSHVYTASGAINSRNEWLSRWSAAAELTLVGTRGLSAGGGLTWTIPVAAPNGFSLSPSASIADNRSQTTNVTFDFPILDLVRKTGPSAEALARLCDRLAIDEEPGRRPLIAGDIGVPAWIRDVVVAADISDAVSTPSGFGHVIEFGLTRKAGLKPEFAVVNLAGSLDPGGELTHSIKLAMTFTFDEDSPGLYGLQRSRPDRPQALPARSSGRSRVGTEAQIKLREQLRGLTIQRLERIAR